MLAVAEDLDGLTREDGLGELEKGHVGTAPGDLDRKETQAGCWQIVKMTVGMGNQLVGLLAGCRQAQRVVNILMDAEWHGGQRDRFENGCSWHTWNG